MPEEVSYLEEEQLILVHSFGRVSIDQARESLRDIERLSSEHDVKDVIFDVRDQETAPRTMDIYEFGKELPKGYRFALVASEKTIRDQRFLEIVAQNRGKQLRVFDEYEEAMEWLLPTHTKSTK